MSDVWQRIAHIMKAVNAGHSRLKFAVAAVTATVKSQNAQVTVINNTISGRPFGLPLIVFWLSHVNFAFL